VKHTENVLCQRPQLVEDTIQNGVKEINHVDVMKFFDNKMNDVLQNGVTYTGGIGNPNWMGNKVEDTIENGVKKTKRSYESSRRRRTKDTIENGVKEIRKFGNMPVQDVEDIIQNGVLETKELYWENTPIIDNVIENGVKEIKTPGKDGDLLGFLDFMSDNNTDSVPQLIDDVIVNGVREDEIVEGVKKTKKGGFNQHYDMFRTIENGTKQTKPQYLQQNVRVGDTIQNGVKETELHKGVRPSAVEDTIQNGIKETKSGIHFFEDTTENVLKNGVKISKPMDEWVNSRNIVNGVIENGINQTKAAFQTIYNPMNFSPELREEKRISDVTDVIDNGVKEIQPLPAQDGNRDWGNYYHRQGDRTKPHTEYVNDVISNGIKKTIWRKVENFPEYENRIIVNGVLINNSKDWEIL
jgi:hypothetical protein